jgi:GTP diphosphokinase / guanosine-3',5'-bis(diphosphate) 3'-diphosphatase
MRHRLRAASSGRIATQISLDISWYLPSMSTLERAIAIAAQAHAGQVDKAGQPYILHPLRVMLGVRGHSEKIAAVLHDVVEDTTVTLPDLTAAGFSADVTDAVFALTKTRGESRLAAAARAKANPIARAVKLCDVADNMDESRLTHITSKDRARLAEYALVRALLLSDG